MLEARDLAWPGLNHPKPLFAGLAFSLAAGESLALTGPAGSGKSVLLRILAGAIRDYAGQVLFRGKELGDWSRDFFEATGAVLDPAGLSPRLTALENLAFHARLYRDGNPASARAALDRLGLSAAAGKRIDGLEPDERFLVALARAQIHRPALLCVDVPARGLSPAASDRLGEALKARRAEGLSTVLAARDRSWADGLCGRALELGGGRKEP